MKSGDLIRYALTMTEGNVDRLIADMRDKPMTQPSSAARNHPMWVMGHLAVVEGAFFHFITGEPHPLAEWEPLFGMGTEPTSDASAYPPFEVVVTKYHELRKRNLQLLDRTGEAGLDQKPASAPPGFEKEMQTVGQSLLILALHQMSHHGQLSDARRAAGVQRLF
jgi:hypothetical protein